MVNKEEKITKKVHKMNNEMTNKQLDSPQDECIHLGLEVEGGK